jgi:D-inositol-3-phosphate glycosyltransferase
MNKLPIALAQADSGLRVDIFTRLQDSDPLAAVPIKHLDGNPHVRLIRLPCGPSDRYVPKEFLYGEPIAEFVTNILAFADREGLRYDLLHGHYADGWETVTILKNRWSLRPPTLLTTHSLGRRKRADSLARNEAPPEELDRYYNFPVRIHSEEQSLAAADCILPLSTPEAEFLTEHYLAVPAGDPRVIVIPNGIELADFPATAPGTRRRVRRNLGVADSTFLLLVPSRVDPRKGQENILRALVEALPALAGYRFCLLLLAWPEPPTDFAVRLRGLIAEHGLANSVVTHPPVPHDQMPDCFAAADGVALPSQEYFSIVMLEAMLLERPLIASIHGGSRDVITDGLNGMLVDHNDVTQLAQTVVRLVKMGKRARREMGHLARQTVLRTYTWDQIAHRLLSIYRQACSGREGASVR